VINGLAVFQSGNSYQTSNYIYNWLSRNSVLNFLALIVKVLQLSVIIKNQFVFLGNSLNQNRLNSTTF